MLSRAGLFLCLAIWLGACASPEPSSPLDAGAETSAAEVAPSGVAPPLPTSEPPSVQASALPNALSTVTAVASAQPAASAPQKKFRYVVGAIGDSLTDEKSHGGQYLEVLRERCPKSTFLGFGKGGNMVNMMRKRFLRDVYADGTPEARKLTHVIILGGLGDILSNETAFRTAKKIGADITTMVGWAHERGAKAYVLKLPPWGKMKAFNAERGAMTREVNAWIDSEVAEKRIDATFDTRAVLACGNVDVLCDENAWKDGIHWSEKGQRAIGDALHKALFSDCE
ncbi:MAG: SGNH/GDSL hydrolase family protein [Myxococcales bacterium]|nr:SGNH/GDSL hydrolase family protein [Myxococcales bacterium]